MVLFVPSEFSIMRGALPSMTATAELVVPRSIPMIGPFTFPLSAFVSSAYPRRNCDVRGARRADDRKEDVARGIACVQCQSRVHARVMANGFEGASTYVPRQSRREHVGCINTLGYAQGGRNDGDDGWEGEEEREVVADGAK